MPALIWLGVAIVAAALAYAIGRPAWRSYQARDARDANADRYLAWRGKAPPRSASVREGMTGEERRNLVAAAALVAVSVVAVIAFFITS